MKDSTKFNVNLGITLLGIGVAAYTATGAGVAAQLAAGIMAYLTSVAGNQSAKWLGDKLDSVPKGQQDIFRNHHLRALISQAAATVVTKVITENEPSVSGTLISAERNIGTALDRAFADPNSPLAELSEFNLPEVLSQFVNKKGKLQLLTVQVWERFLKTLPDELWPKERRNIAEALHADFASALWSLVKENAAKDGEGTAALEVLYLSRILKAAERSANRVDIAPLSRRIEKLVGSLDWRATEYFRNLFAQNKLLAQKLDSHAKALGGKVDRLSERQAVGTKVTHRKLDGIKGSLDRQFATAPLAAYYKALRDQFSTYENVGLPVPERDGKEGEQDKPILIRKLFVAPACSDAHFSPEAFDAELRYRKNPAVPLLPWLASAKSRTVLLADPGMGKSTLVQWLISTLADEAVPLDEKRLRGAIPLPFILRDLVPLLPQKVKDWNWDALVDAFRQWRHRGKGAPLAAPLTADDAFFHSILSSGDAFFLIDGLDEIGDPQRRAAIRDAIWEGFKKYPQARWLVTSRIIGYERAEVDRKWERVTGEKPFPETGLVLGENLDSARVPEGVQEVISLATSVKGADGNVRTPRRRHRLQMLAKRLYLAPFDDNQQLGFARNWYCPRLGEAAGMLRADDFMEAIRRHEHTRVISRVPNLLYLLALLFRHRARLPDGRALVYASISSAYLADIDLGKRLPDSLIVPWKPEEKEDLLAIVAMRMQEIRIAKRQEIESDEDVMGQRGDILVTREQLEQWLGPHFGGVTDAAACAELHHFLDHIANRSGLLLPRGEGIFGFAHLSFQEYYAACYLEKEFRRILNEKAQPAGDIFGSSTGIAKADEEKMFGRMAALPAWHEPLLFLVEKLRHSPPDTRTIIGWTFPQLAKEPKDTDWMPFTAAQLLAGISLDQEVTLDDAQRAKIWRSLWQADFAAWNDDWNIAPYLIFAGSPYHIPVLQAAASLRPTRLWLSGCSGMSNLDPLSELSALQILSISGFKEVSDLRPLSGLASLDTLHLTDCIRVNNLEPLGELSSLKVLSLDGCTGVSNLEPLSRLSSLETLLLGNCTGISDLKPLSRLSSLRQLFIDRGMSKEGLAELEMSLPQLKITRSF